MTTYLIKLKTMDDAYLNDFRIDNGFIAWSNDKCDGWLYGYDEAVEMCFKINRYFNTVDFAVMVEVA